MDKIDPYTAYMNINTTNGHNRRIVLICGGCKGTIMGSYC